MLGWLLACGLEPPLAFEELLVDQMTFDVVLGDLKFADEDGSGSVESMDYSLAVSEEPLYEDAYAKSDSEVDGGLVLAPVELAYDDVFEVTDLFHVDDLIPFEVVAHYVYDSAAVHLEYVVHGSGELPAPRAPRFAPRLLSSANLAVEVVNDNVDDVQIAMQGTSIEVDGRQVANGDPLPFRVPGEGGSLTVDFPLVPGAEGRTVRIRADAVVETVFGEIPLAVDEETELR
jgi:hypothetical protein